MRSFFIAFVWCVGVVAGCSYVEVPIADKDAVNGTRYVIGRTLEYGDMLSSVEHRIKVHPRGERGGRFGFVSMESHLALPLAKPFWISLDGMNEASLTISAHVLKESQYEAPSLLCPSRDVLVPDFVSSLLRHCENVSDALEFLAEHRVVLPGSLTNLLGLHWGIADGSGRSVVVEYVAGERKVYDGVRVMTNDPPLDFHLRNLNTYANLNPTFPHQNEFLGVETIGHGYNLAGLPGDSSPPSRFVQLFYLRGYASRFSPPRTTEDGMVLATGLLNRVFIPLGDVAPDRTLPGGILDNYDYTQWAALKLPAEKRLLIRGYRNLRWRQIDLNKVDFARAVVWPVEDGTLGVDDITAEGEAEEAEAMV